MKSMDQFGKALVDYAGVARFRLEQNESRLEGRGYFEAAQFPSGRISISVVPTDTLRPSHVSLRVDPDGELSFEGQDLHGWSLKPGGQMFFSHVQWLLAPMARQPTELSFGAQYISAKRKGASEDGYSTARFLVSNLLWHHQSDKEPEAISLSAQGFEALITPIAGYSEIAPRLSATKGVEPTALVCLEAPREQRPLGEFRDFVDNLIYVFRLVTGNLVNWYYGEAIDGRAGRAVERIHNYALSRPYSNTITFRPLKSGYVSLVPNLSVDALTRAFFNDSGHNLENATLKGLINQFTDACDPSLSLEANGLLACVLTELIAAKHAHARGASEAVPRRDFEARVRPTLEAAINETTLPRAIKDHVLQQLRGAYRSSFRQKLKSLNDDLRLSLTRSHINRIVKLRNALVHEGRYPISLRLRAWIQRLPLPNMDEFYRTVPTHRVRWHTARFPRRKPFGSLVVLA